MRFGQNTTPDGLIRRGERLTKCENLWDTKNRKINHMIDKHFSKSLMSEVDDSFESEAPRLQEESDFLKSELEKLVCYTLDKNIITMDDVEKICTTKVTNHIFDMINAIADKKQKQALEQYYDLLSLKEPPLRILFLIARQFNMLLQVKELKLKGYDNRIISEKMSLQSFIVGKYINQSAKFSKGDLKKAVSACVDAEESVKTGKIADILSVELLIVEYSL